MARPMATAMANAVIIWFRKRTQLLNEFIIIGMATHNGGEMTCIE